MPTASTLRILDWKTEDTDMTGGYRFESVDADGNSSLFLHVVSLDDTISTAVVDDVAGQHGVKLALKGGDTATVLFDDTKLGATVDWARGNGTPVTAGARTVAVEALPLLK